MRTLAVVCALIALGVARPARAISYETFIDVDDESDLQDLLSAQAIAQDTFDELLELLANGVDVNTADRAQLYALPNLTYEDVDQIIAFRDAQNGLIKDPAALVAAGALSKEKFLALAAFLALAGETYPSGVQGRHDQCFEVTTETLPTGAPVPCAGRQLTSIGRAELSLGHKLTVTALLEHQLLDDNRLNATAFRQDVAAWAIALWRPIPELRLRARVRYLDTAIERASYLETSLSGLVDAAVTLRKRDLLRLRVETKLWLDDRLSTRLREPDPELQLWLSYEARL